MSSLGAPAARILSYWATVGRPQKPAFLILLISWGIGQVGGLFLLSESHFDTSSAPKQF